MIQDDGSRWEILTQDDLYKEVGFEEALRWEEAGFQVAPILTGEQAQELLAWSRAGVGAN